MVIGNIDLVKYGIELVFCFVILLVMHELGHYLAGLYYGKKIKFRFVTSPLLKVIPVPRYIWDMLEGLNPVQRLIVSLSGFASEFAFCVLYSAFLTNGKFSHMLCLLCILHFALYPMYAGEYNDFHWMYIAKKIKD